MSEISILLGLGNPGATYESTRHNLGSKVLDLLAARHRIRWRGISKIALEARLPLAGREVHLVKPLVYMNASGEALEMFGPPDPNAVLVICDDIHLPLGTIRLRKRGGTGGHKGLESVEAHLGADDFPRLRMGVGSPPPGMEWSDYVLEPFPDEELEEVERMVAAAAECLETVLGNGLEAAMQAFNGKALP